MGILSNSPFRKHRTAAENWSPPPHLLMEKKLKRLANCRVDCACLAKYEIFVDLVCNWSRTRERERGEHKTEKTFFCHISCQHDFFFRFKNNYLYTYTYYVKWVRMFFRNFRSIHIVLHTIFVFWTILLYICAKNLYVIYE